MFFEVVVVGNLFGGKSLFEASAFSVESIANDSVDFTFDVIVGNLSSACFESCDDKRLIDQLFSCFEIGLFELLFEFVSLIAAIKLGKNG